MTKKAAVALAIVLLGLVAWGLFFEAGSTKIIIDGRELTGPLTVGPAGLIVSLVSMLCAAIILLFVFAGFGTLVLGGVVLAGLIVAGLAFPILSLLLLPLALVWIFIAVIRKVQL